MTEVFSRELQRRTTQSGSTPLITYYDETRGERVELSGVSFANWVDKTAGLLTDEILVEPGDRVRLTLATAHPAHWITLVWVAAAWRARCVVTLGAQGEAAVEVIGPETPPGGDPETVACSLHPLGLGFSTPLPAGVLDYGVEVRTFPDSFTGPQPAPSDLAWVADGQQLSQADVVAGSGSADRRLITAQPPWQVVRTALVEPVLGGGSAVVVVGATRDRLAEIAAAERVRRPD